MNFIEFLWLSHIFSIFNVNYSMLIVISITVVVGLWFCCCLRKLLLFCCYLHCLFHPIRKQRENSENTSKKLTNPHWIYRRWSLHPTTKYQLKTIKIKSKTNKKQHTRAVSLSFVEHGLLERLLFLGRSKCLLIVILNNIKLLKHTNIQWNTLAMILLPSWSRMTIPLTL